MPTEGAPPDRVKGSMAPPGDAPSDWGKDWTPEKAHTAYLAAKMFVERNPQHGSLPDEQSEFRAMMSAFSPKVWNAYAMPRKLPLAEER